jgi:hypothetical protein
LNRPEPGDKFQKVTGDELEDVKRYFDDKEKGIMRPTDIAPLPRDPLEGKVKDVDPDCVTSKVLGNGIERIDNGDNDLECIKITGDQLNNFANPQKTSDRPCKLRTLFRDADDDKEGVKYYYRKVLGSGKDKGGNEPLTEVN